MLTFVRRESYVFKLSVNNSSSSEIRSWFTDASFNHSKSMVIPLLDNMLSNNILTGQKARLFVEWHGFKMCASRADC